MEVNKCSVYLPRKTHTANQSLTIDTIEPRKSVGQAAALPVMGNKRHLQLRPNHLRLKHVQENLSVPVLVLYSWRS